MEVGKKHFSCSSRALELIDIVHPLERVVSRGNHEVFVQYGGQNAIMAL